MNTIQYFRKRHLLLRAIAKAVNVRLRKRPSPADRKFSMTDAKRGEDYILLVRQGDFWMFCVLDALDRIALEVTYGYGRILNVDGVRYHDAGRIVRVDVVPNEHTLGMLERLLAQLDR